MIDLSRVNRKQLLLAIMIGLGFLWASSTYISQMFHLSALTSPDHIDRIALGYNYTAQAIGAITVIFFTHKLKRICFSSKILTTTLLISALSIPFILTVPSLIIVILSGIVMNFCHGFLTGLYLMYLGLFPSRRRGVIFGLAYSSGSLLTYLLSRLMGSIAPELSSAAFIYVFLVLLNLLLSKTFISDMMSQHTEASTKINIIQTNQLPRWIKFWSPLFILLFLMSLLSALGGDYRSSYIFSTNVDFHQTRIYYAFGLLIAGLVSDYSRKLGAHFCIIAIFFPFVSISLRSIPESIQMVWNLSYFFLAFYTVFRVVVTVDLADYDQSLFYLASLGFIISRAGDMLFALIPRTLYNSMSKATIVAVILTLVLIFTYLKVYLKLYHPSKNQVDLDSDAIFHAFSDRYNLTQREKDVFSAILDGYSNSEISGRLFISESTVKFHIKNLLKKTDCHNRTELLKRYRNWA